VNLNPEAIHRILVYISHLVNGKSEKKITNLFHTKKLNFQY